MAESMTAYTIDQQLAATRAKQAAALAAIRERDPGYDPWRPIPTPAELAVRDAARAAQPTPEREAEPEQLGDPRDALRSAKDAYDAALDQQRRAQSVVERAKQRMDAADAEMQSFADLDAQITAWTAQQIRDDVAAEMPFALANAQRERSRAIDRLTPRTRPTRCLTPKPRRPTSLCKASGSTLRRRYALRHGGW